MFEQIITKQCWKCKEVKPLDRFCKSKRYKDKHDNMCKICNNRRSSLHARTPQRKASLKQYEQTLKGKQTRSKIGKRYKERFPLQRKAKNAVNHAVTAGKLLNINSLFCIVCFRNICFEPAKQYHHYLGYKRKHWFDVIPLCIKCHKSQHS